MRHDSVDHILQTSVIQGHGSWDPIVLLVSESVLDLFLLQLGANEGLWNFPVAPA